MRRLLMISPVFIVNAGVGTYTSDDKFGRLYSLASTIY